MNLKSLAIFTMGCLFSLNTYAALYAPKNYTCIPENGQCGCYQQESLAFPVKTYFSSEYCTENGQTHYTFSIIYLYLSPKSISAIYMNSDNSTKPAINVLSQITNLFPNMADENKWTTNGSYGYICSSIDNPQLCPMNLTP